MKKSIALLTGMMIAAFSSLALAAESPDVRVYVKVTPQIAVAAPQTLINMGETSTGNVTADIGFYIQANTEAVDISAAASPLFKGGVVDSQYTLPVNIAAGVPIVAAQANPLAFGSNVAAYNGSQTTVAGFPAFTTAAITFESGQNGIFDMPVTATFAWAQATSLPMGEYSGAVKLYAIANPTATLPGI